MTDKSQARMLALSKTLLKPTRLRDQQGTLHFTFLSEERVTPKLLRGFEQQPDLNPQDYPHPKQYIKPVEQKKKQKKQK
jgi:hypothetical protein